MVSVAVMTVLMGGIGSAMVLATRAIPDGRSALDDAVNGYHAAEQLSGELYCAQSFTVRTKVRQAEAFGVHEFAIADDANGHARLAEVIPGLEDCVDLL